MWYKKTFCRNNIYIQKKRNDIFFRSTRCKKPIAHAIPLHLMLANTRHRHQDKTFFTEFHKEISQCKNTIESRITIFSQSVFTNNYCKLATVLKTCFNFSIILRVAFL